MSGGKVERSGLTRCRIIETQRLNMLKGLESLRTLVRLTGKKNSMRSICVNPGYPKIRVDARFRYPNRPRNHSKTLPFHDLYLTLFNPLNENKKKPSGPALAGKKIGPHGPASTNPHEVRQKVIERFIARWRKEVGNDIYPAFRLIVPEKDRERPMYGLKETTIAKLLIRVMKINKTSEDAQNLLNWRHPGQTTASRMAGDFAGRCYEVISKRPMLTEAGQVTIDEVNDLLDALATTDHEGQAKVFAESYKRMNAEELLWLIRIILRQMKVGATEKTFFNIWHPDADDLFNISSNLRRVCWELYDPSVRLGGEDRGVTLMQCFQPQLAQFQMNSFQKMVDRMRPTEGDAVFWIEEKLDGERMQLHMMTDDHHPGGKKFGFWSRKAKDYTYLYGDGFMDEKSALTQHIKEAFDEGVQNIILDGEMITWDPKEDVMVPFGTLKTAAIGQRDNPYSMGCRPFYKVFDILYLNGQVLTNYTLRDRRKALETAVRDVHRRLEIHTYKEAASAAEVEPMLRKVVAEASEGLVLKNPRSAYRLNQRNDDWMKVKPEYMTEFGENLDCLIIGGYYGSGHRGGMLSSFMCGLRVDQSHIQQGAHPMKFYSFFKVGGGFTGADYAAIRHKTDGKWRKWDPKRPPTEYIALAGDESHQYERPDEWIMPCDSAVIEVKAASVSATDQFKMNFTLRFPRFKRIRDDRKWDNALSIADFIALKTEAEKERRDKQFEVDDSRRKRQRTSRKNPLTIAGSETVTQNDFVAKAPSVFQGLSFYVMTGSSKPNKRSKAELEAMVKSHGGSIFQNDSRPGTICIGDSRTVHVASAVKRGNVGIVRSCWLFDNIRQSELEGNRPALLLPFEPRHMFCCKEDSEALLHNNLDAYGDSFARYTTVEELRVIIDAMPARHDRDFDVAGFRTELAEHNHDLPGLPGWMFEGLLLYADYPRENGALPSSDLAHLQLNQAYYTAHFAGARFTDELVEGITHILVDGDRGRWREMRGKISGFSRLPRLVTIDWIERSWQEKTLLDEERRCLSSATAASKLRHGLIALPRFFPWLTGFAATATQVESGWGWPTARYSPTVPETACASELITGKRAAMYALQDARSKARFREYVQSTYVEPFFVCMDVGAKWVPPGVRFPQKSRERL
ncbi:MAG: hypothetical protein Q9163_001828 [Psora crenata]